MATASKSHSQIEISAQVPRFSIDAVENNGREKVPFFKSQSRRITRDTWLISLFLLLQIVVFFVTMGFNDCSTNSYGDCAAKLLGRLSFQPLSENPLLGPAASTFTLRTGIVFVVCSLDEMGALRKNLVENHEIWRLFTCPWLHAGAFHLAINLGSVVFIGVYMEQEFGPLRIAMIYILSALFGGLFAVLFVRDSPSVCSSAALFGLIGAMHSALIRNWDFYTHKFAALMLMLFVSGLSLILGLLPYIDNFANIGGFLSGFLLGFVMLFAPQSRPVPKHKAGLLEYDIKSSIRLNEKLDKPLLRITCLVLFSIILAGCLIAALKGVNLNHRCGFCQYIDCVPTKRWSCNEMTSACETMVSDAQSTLTCMANGNFRIFPYTNISQARTRDLCTLICS